MLRIVFPSQNSGTGAALLHQCGPREAPTAR
nr:MAG TPA: hypothetical protein [Caudoviricetes sp.]